MLSCLNTQFFADITVHGEWKFHFLRNAPKNVGHEIFVREVNGRFGEELRLLIAKRSTNLTTTLHHEIPHGGQ